MIKPFSFIALAVVMAMPSSYAQAVPAKSNNYVVFNLKGDCNQEDCIALTKDVLKDEASSIVSVDAAALASHQTVDYKALIITFKDLKAAPYGPVMQKMVALGYNVISYVIHDTHTGQDTILPH